MKAMAPLVLSCGHELMLYTDTEEGEVVRCPVCSADAIVDRSQFSNSGRPTKMCEEHLTPSAHAVFLAIDQGIELNERGHVVGRGGVS